MLGISEENQAAPKTLSKFPEYLEAGTTVKQPVIMCVLCLLNDVLFGNDKQQVDVYLLIRPVCFRNLSRPLRNRFYCVTDSHPLDLILASFKRNKVFRHENRSKRAEGNLNCFQNCLVTSYWQINRKPLAMNKSITWQMFWPRKKPFHIQTSKIISSPVRSPVMKRISTFRYKIFIAVGCFRLQLPMLEICNTVAIPFTLMTKTRACHAHPRYLDIKLVP